MLSWLLLVFTLGVPLATSRTGAQSTTTTSSASNITNITSNTTVPATATTAILVPTTVDFTTSTTTTVPFPTTTTTTAATTATTATTATPTPSTATTTTAILVPTTVDFTTSTTTTVSFPTTTTATTATTATPPPSTGTTTTTATTATPPPSTATTTTAILVPTTTVDITTSPSTTSPPATTPTPTPPFSPPTTRANSTTPSPPPSTLTNSTDPLPTTPPFNTTTNSTTLPPTSIPPFTNSTPPLPPTTITPPTTTPLVCENGGIVLDGVCICPDEWTGETCSEENFCPAQQLGEFNFPRTPIGWFAYSVEICPEGTSGAGKPRASTRCVSNNGSPSFERAQEFMCEQTLSDLQQNLTSPADLESLASSTLILTSNPEALTAENVTAAAEIASKLLLSPNATESVMAATIATISQLLDISTLDDSSENNATLGLTVNLEQLAVDLSLNFNSSESQVVQPNLVVQSAQVPAADTQGVQFTSLSGTSGSFVADRIKLNTNTSKVVVDKGTVADTLIYIQFPSEAVSGRQKPSGVSLGFVLYQNDRFFRSRRFKSKRANIRVLSASVRGQERSVVPQHVEMLFRPTMANGTSLYDFACVFWNYSLGDWSTDGCYKGNTSDGLLRCSCNHTTNFAALFSIRETYEYAALDWISNVGLSLSILFLIITIIHHVKENFQKDENKNSMIAPFCIYVSLLAFIITFLSGAGNSSGQDDDPGKIDTQTNSLLESDEHVEPDKGSCSAVAAMLHFFLLATFMWNSVRCTLILLVQAMRRSLPPYWTPLSFAVGWGVPAVLMAITLGITYSTDNPLGYRQEEFCWLAALDKAKQFHFGKPMFWGLLLPIGLILIYNIVLLVIFSLKTFKDDNRSSMMKKFLSSFSLVVITGLSWTLGYLVLVTSGDAHLALSILFCLCTTTQGIQIFILFTATTQSFKDSVSQFVHYVSSISINFSRKRRTYHFNRNVGTTAASVYYRFHGETATINLVQLRERPA